MHEGCVDKGIYRAPKSRYHLESGVDDWHWFCLIHIRDYNARWNYYNNMSETEIERERRADVTWQRPSWPLGASASRGGGPVEVFVEVFIQAFLFKTPLISSMRRLLPILFLNQLFQLRRQRAGRSRFLSCLVRFLKMICESVTESSLKNITQMRTGEALRRKKRLNGSMKPMRF